MSQRPKIEPSSLVVIFAITAMFLPTIVCLAQEELGAINVHDESVTESTKVPLALTGDFTLATATQTEEFDPRVETEESEPQTAFEWDNDGFEWDNDGLDLETNLDEPHHQLSGDNFLTQRIPLLQSSGTWLWRGHWYTEQSLVLMYRAMPNNKIISRDQTFTQRVIGMGQTLVTHPADNQDPLQTSGQTFKTEPGVKLTIGNIIGRDAYNRDHALEFTFWGLFDFDGRDKLTAVQAGADDGDFHVRDLGYNIFRLDGLNLDQEIGPTSGNFILPISIVGFSNALSHSYVFTSDLNSYEFNWKKRSRLRRDRLLLQPNGKWHRDINSGTILTTLAGMRVLRHNELFLWDSIGAIDSDAGGGNTGRGRYEVRAYNDMVGVQIGAGILRQHANWHWGIKLKGGGLHNFADREIDIYVNDMGETTQVGDRSNDGQLAFLGETGAYIGWQVRPNVTLKASYDILYYTGVILARDSIELNAENAQQDEGFSSFKPATISGTFRPFEVRGDALYHAISAGIEIVW